MPTVDGAHRLATPAPRQGARHTVPHSTVPCRTAGKVPRSRGAGGPAAAPAAACRPAGRSGSRSDAWKDLCGAVAVKTRPRMAVLISQVRGDADADVPGGAATMDDREDSACHAAVTSSRVIRSTRLRSGKPPSAMTGLPVALRGSHLVGDCAPYSTTKGQPRAAAACAGPVSM